MALMDKMNMNHDQIQSLSVYKLGTYLAKNKVLEHLDVSYNNFKKRDIAYLAEKLLTNHSLLGLHIEAGNCGTEGKAKVDSIGLLSFQPKITDMEDKFRTSAGALIRNDNTHD